MLRNEFYRMLKSVIDAEQFVEDDIRSIVRIKLPLKIEDVKDLKLWMLSIFGNFHVPRVDPQDNPLYAGYKFNSHFIDYDKKTIDVNEHGKIFARPEILADELIHDPNKWGSFLEGLFAAILNDPQGLNYLVEMISNSSFIDDVKDKVALKLLNDPNFESIVNNSLLIPFDTSKLIGTWKQTGIDTVILTVTQNSWTLTGPAPASNWSQYTGDKYKSIDFRDFLLIKPNVSYPNAELALITGKFYDDKIMITLNDSNVPNTMTRNFLMEKIS